MVLEVDCGEPSGSVSSGATSLEGGGRSSCASLKKSMGSSSLRMLIPVVVLTLRKDGGRPPWKLSDVIDSLLPSMLGSEDRGSSCGVGFRSLRRSSGGMFCHSDPNVTIEAFLP